MMRVIGAVLAAVALATPAGAQLRLDEGPSLFTLGVVYAIADGKRVDQRLDGWGVSAGVDEVSYDGRSSLGFAFTYFTAEADRAEAGEDARYHYRSIPVRVTFNFLNDSFFSDDLAHVFTVALGFRH